MADEVMVNIPEIPADAVRGDIPEILKAPRVSKEIRDAVISRVKIGTEKFFSQPCLKNHRELEGVSKKAQKISDEITRLAPYVGDAGCTALSVIFSEILGKKVDYAKDTAVRAEGMNMFSSLVPTQNKNGHDYPIGSIAVQCCPKNHFNFLIRVDGKYGNGMDNKISSFRRPTDEEIESMPDEQILEIARYII